MSPRASRGSSIGPMKGQHRSRTDHSPYASPPSLSMLSSSMATGNSSGSNLCSSMMYQNISYLQPPSDPSSWRRANSDSALHSLVIPSVVPDSSEESSNNSNDPRDNYPYGGLSHSPKHNDSQSVIPTTVGDGSTLLTVGEIPSSISTGSLPDLTNFQFSTPPLQQPIDPEEIQFTHSPNSTVRFYIQHYYWIWFFRLVNNIYWLLLFLFDCRVLYLWHTLHPVVRQTLIPITSLKE